MISTNDVLGLIFASMHDDAVIDLTKKKNDGFNSFRGKIPSYRFSAV